MSAGGADPSLRPPIRPIELDLGRPWPLIDGPTGGEAWGGVQILVRLHGSPVGLILAPLPQSGIDPAELRAIVEPVVADAAAAHRLEHGCGPGAPASAAGPATPRPACLVARARISAEGPPLSVVIPTRNRADRLACCVDSVLATGYHDLRVIVVDNAPSGPETQDLVRRRSDWSGRVLYVQEDRAGVARARNRGLAVAGTALVAFLDDDVLVDPGWAAGLVSELTGEPGVGCVTGPIVAAELVELPQIWIEEYGGFCKGFVRRVYDCAQPPPSAPLFPYAAGRFGSGANMAFRAGDLAGAGGFDEALGGGTLSRGGEDLAAFFDVLAAGHRLVYQPSMLVRHYHHRDLAALRRTLLGYGMGLGAYLTKAVYDRPERLLDIARRARPGLNYLLNGSSAKNRGRSASYPWELTAREFLGLGIGPYAYLAARYALRRARDSERRAGAKR